MKKWFRRLGKTAQTAVIVGAILAIVSISVYAAWLLTKQSSGVGVIYGTFSLTDLTTGSTTPGGTDWVVLEVQVTNEYNLTASIDEAHTVSDVPQVEISPNINWESLDGPNFGGMDNGLGPVPINSGETIRLLGKWRAPSDAPTGEVNFTMSVTCSAD